MDRDSKLFASIKTFIVKWLDDNRSEITNNNIQIEEVENNENIYRIFLDFKNCMGELVVTNPEFAPYRFVSIQILSLKGTDAHLIYYWYDTDKDSVKDIIDNIEKSIKFGIDYKLD